ncbi:cleft lip and palate associated transmembrane protein [Crepidotus variabilis]|uniref:Cleft lip and palate associated transmembrane protein n=1 Tax=Crepidotus variabilis TaxID=179855 RepID=A0A9P6ET14_9AGAR|nr:cleft lip and palate associated transmembrane protein [Crepidotus variabilis]
MPDAAPAAAVAPGGQRPAEEESAVDKMWAIGKQMLIAWVVMQLATKFVLPQFQKAIQKPEVVPTSEPGFVNQKAEQIDPHLLPPVDAVPYWPLGTTMDMHVYLTTKNDGFARWSAPYRKDSDQSLPNFVWKNITYGDYNDHRSIDFEVKFPPSVLNNGSLWADIYLALDSVSLDPRAETFNPQRVHHVRKLLTPYLPQIKVRKQKNLLAAKNDSQHEEEDEEPDVIAPHWHKDVTLAIVSDATVVPFSTLPPPIMEHVWLVDQERDTSGKRGYYKPVVFPNEFWHLRQHYIQINQTTPSLPIHITLQPMSWMKFQIFASMTHGFNEAQKQQGQGSSAEFDEIKRMLLETNPWFLGLTALVSLLHVVFEMLAFKSDVSHWREKKEMTGVSVRTIVTNVFVQTVILLYLIDNNDSTSWMILMGSGMGVLVEAWKITKAVDISVVPAPAGSLLPYKIDVKDKHVLSEDEKKTQEYDALAFRYVSYAAIPLLLGYSVYSLIYETHRGWYSFVISTLTSFVYMFGFAQLIPQLIINYKLKSVSHMPMKAMVYKTLSTVVDDLFAFCIKMPFLHRLACFRDDVVFLIFLYQRWIYRIDPKRINEYGQVMAHDADEVGDKTGERESKKDR